MHVLKTQDLCVVVECGGDTYVHVCVCSCACSCGSQRLIFVFSSVVLCLNLKSFWYFCICLFSENMHMEVKGTTWQHLFLPSTVWPLGIELGSLDLVASPLSIETSCRTPLNIFTLLFCVFVCVCTFIYATPHV